MTQERQRIEIARWLGWKHLPKDRDMVQYTAQMPDGNWDMIPNYPGDLNAMHEAERHMRNGDWTRYCQYLSEYGGGTVRFVSVHASAQNRAKAFLKTLGLWEDDIPANVPSHLSRLLLASEPAPQAKCQKCRRHGIR